MARRTVHTATEAVEPPEARSAGDPCCPNATCEMYLNLSRPVRPDFRRILSQYVHRWWDSGLWPHCHGPGQGLSSREVYGCVYREVIPSSFSGHRLLLQSQSWRARRMRRPEQCSSPLAPPDGDTSGPACAQRTHPTTPCMCLSPICALSRPDTWRDGPRSRTYMFCRLQRGTGTTEWDLRMIGYVHVLQEG